MTVISPVVRRPAILLLGVTLAPLALAQICPPGNPRVAPDNRYIDHGNGTVTDQETGLMWKRCSEGQNGSNCSGNLTLMNWQIALQTAGASSFAGYSDWRLPSVKELHSLLETGCHSPAINTTRFPNTPGGLYWSSTTEAYEAPFAWIVIFSIGGVSAGVNNVNKSGSAGVRLVRGGQ